MTRHWGVRCPDGKVMCELCFNRFSDTELMRDKDDPSKRWNICLWCGWENDTVPVLCCSLHKEVGCCDPNDCGPCCENCPTCPTLILHDLIECVKFNGFEVVRGDFTNRNGQRQRIFIRPKNIRRLAHNVLRAIDDRIAEADGMNDSI